jgi:hypothetical protein
LQFTEHFGLIFGIVEHLKHIGKFFVDLSLLCRVVVINFPSKPVFQISKLTVFGFGVHVDKPFEFRRWVNDTGLALEVAMPDSKIHIRTNENWEIHGGYGLITVKFYMQGAFVDNIHGIQMEIPAVLIATPDSERFWLDHLEIGHTWLVPFF